jgi:hypothetical protein
MLSASRRRVEQRSKAIPSEMRTLEGSVLTPELKARKRASLQTELLELRSRAAGIETVTQSLQD